MTHHAIRRTLAAAAALTMLAGMAACGSGDNGKSGSGAKSASGGKSLVVYSPNSEGLIQATVPTFEEKYGIKVDLIQASTGELFKKVQSEKDAPVADVLFGGSGSEYAENKDLFQPYTAKENDKSFKEYRNTSGVYTPYTLDGSLLVVNPDLTRGMKIDGYDSLLNPALKGKIATADPSNSSSAFCQLTNMLAAEGGLESPEAWNYVKKLFTNIDGKISSSSSNVYKTVADGEMAVGLTYEDPAMKLVKDGANVKIVYPKEGAVFLGGSMAIVKKAKNMENAKKFIDYVMSKEVQDAMGTQTTNRPVREDAKLSKDLKPMKDIKTITEDSKYVFNHRQDLVDKYSEMFASIQSK